VKEDSTLAPKPLNILEKGIDSMKKKTNQGLQRSTEIMAGMTLMMKFPLSPSNSLAL